MKQIETLQKPENISAVTSLYLSLFQAFKKYGFEVVPSELGPINFESFDLELNAYDSHIPSRVQIFFEPAQTWRVTTPHNFMGRNLLFVMGEIVGVTLDETKIGIDKEKACYIYDFT